jgi:hypothetical protein
MTHNKTKRILALTTFSALALFSVNLMGCGEDNPTTPVEKTCSELGSDLRTSKGGTNPAFQVISPNGGEVFTVGQTLNVKVASADNKKDGMLHLMVENDAGVTTALAWPSFTASVNFQETCTYSMVLPDSILGPSLGKKVSLVSTKIKIRAGQYNHESQFNDLSDEYFTIKAK